MLHVFGLPTLYTCELTSSTITDFSLFTLCVSAWKISLTNQINIYVFHVKISGCTWGYCLQKKRYNLSEQVKGKILVTQGGRGSIKE